MMRGRTLPRLRVAGALVLVWALAACDLSTSTSQEPGTSLRTSGVDGSTEATLLSGGYTTVTDGDFELFASWRDPWDTGTCVDLFVRNTGPTIDVWTITVTLDKTVQSMSYASAGTHRLYVDAGRLVIVPIKPLRLAAGDGEAIAYCAEPRTRPVALAVEAAAVVSSAEPKADVADEPDAKEDDDAQDDTEEPRPWGNATLQAGAFSLTALLDSESDKGGCLRLRLKNNGDRVQNWSLALDLDGALTKLSATWGAFAAWGDTLTGRVLIEPFDPNQPLEKGASAQFGFCVEPKLTPISAAVTADPVPEG